jgi:hypothetical protein
MTRYISCTETAKLVRKALKENFPGIKFSVKKSVGGSSIYVRWTDGPADLAVEQVVKFFEGATFDDSIDLKSYVTVEMDGEEIHFGADYIICNRSMSRAFVEAIVKQFCDYVVIPMLPIEGTEEHAWVNMNRLDYYAERELRQLLLNTDAKDMHRVYEAEEEREAQERTEWEAGAAERTRKAEEERKAREAQEHARKERERIEAEKRAREQQEQSRRSRQHQERDALKMAQRAVLSSKYTAITYLGLPLMTTDREAVLTAFRNKVREMADGKGGYNGDMDFLVQVKEKALGV